MPVHMVGYPCDMKKLCALARKHHLAVIEDVAQACGGSFQGRALGTWGTLGCFSLDAYKVIGSGEGGMVITDDEWLHTRAQSYHDTAACWRPNRFARERRPGELFCGENYRLSELNAAVALAQLRKLDGITRRTKAVYDQLRRAIKLPKCARWVAANDPDGVCGYTLAMIFDNTEQALKTMQADIGIGGLAAGNARGARDWHVYWNWEHILEQKTLTAEGCPFTCPHVKQLPRYSADMCPRTRDIMLRVGMIRITPADTKPWAAAYAKQVNAKLAELF
jgi:dTDP-4-amino-4,6-dideoxygalactose transaminase